MKLSLVVVTAGKQEGKVLNISLAQFVIGRDPQCQLRPASPSISKRHCALIQRDNQVFLRDFDSTNGTFVNEVPIKGEMELHEGDKLKVGPLEFTVKIEATTAVNRPTPVPATKSQPPKPAPVEKKAATPPRPAPAPAVSEETPADDDSIAAMLLSLQDDSEGSPGLGGGVVPEGSTVMDLALLPPGEGGEENKDGKAKPTTPASTSNAAKALLDKYMRRPR